MTDTTPRPGPRRSPDHPARLADPAPFGEDLDQEPRLRPTRLRDFVGQPTVQEQLQIFLEAARRRGEALDHVLFHGPPGLGKTTLAAILASEMGVEVPRQLSVVSWGDSVLCRLTHPAITALAHDPMAYGAHAARRLLEVIDGAPPRAFLESAHTLVPRGSTSPA